ncbi:csd-like protein, partial [Haemophilus influenzae]
MRVAILRIKERSWEINTMLPWKSSKKFSNHSIASTSKWLVHQVANFVTWHETAKKCGAKIRVLPILDNWLIDENALISALSEKTKLVALNFVSNVTGTEQPIKRLIQLIRIHSHALVLVDAAQAISHIKIDLQDLDADFLAFSAHKIYGPNGLGVLTGKLTALSQLQPLFFGGKMVDRVSNNRITFAEL